MPLQVTVSSSHHEDCCTHPGAAAHDQEESSSYPPLYGIAPSKRRRCQPAVASGSSPPQDQGHEQQQQQLSTSSSGDDHSSRMDRLLARWHWALGFSSPRVISLAMHIYRRAATRAVRPPPHSVADTTRQTLAASLWLAAKLDDEQATIPGAAEMGVCTGVSARKLVAAEVQLLQTLDWNALAGIPR